MVAPDQIRSARVGLGTLLARTRDAAGLTQKELGDAIFYGRSSVANVETGRQNVPRKFWEGCDRVLQTGGVLCRQYEQLEVLAGRFRSETATAAIIQFGTLSLPSSLAVPGMDSQLSPVPPLALALSPDQPGGHAISPATVAHDVLAGELCARGVGMLPTNDRRSIDSAQAMLDRAVARDPRFATAIAARGYARWRQYFAGWAPDPALALLGALRDVDAALALEPSSIAGHMTFIRACWDLGWHHRALEAGRFVFIRHPGSIDAANAYARSLLNAGMAEQALTLTDTVLLEDPTNPTATKLSIWCHVMLGQHVNAIKLAQPYLRGAPGDANTRWAIALALHHLRRPEAVQVAQAGLEADPADLTLWWLLGAVCRTMGNEAEAQKAWVAGIATTDGSSSGSNHRRAVWAAGIHAALGETPTAIGIGREVIQADPMNGYLRYRLFHVLAELGDIHAALHMLETAVQCGFMSAEILRQEEVLLPEDLVRNGRYEQTVQALLTTVDTARQEELPFINRPSNNQLPEASQW